MTPISAQAYGADLRVTLPLIEITLRSTEGVAAPLGQPVCENAQIAGDGLQPLSADEPLEGGGLALRRKPAPAPVFGGSGPVGARRRGRSRRTQGLLVLLRHGLSSRLLRLAYRAKK